MIKKIKNIALIFVLLAGVLGNAFASAAVHDASKISIEKSAVGNDLVDVWGCIYNLFIKCC